MKHPVSRPTSAFRAAAAAPQAGMRGATPGNVLASWAQRSLSTTPKVQAQLKVAAPGDALEWEADRIAHAVVGHKESPATSGMATQGDTVQAKCSACKEEDDERKTRPKIQRKSKAGEASTAEGAISNQDLARHSGTPLPRSIRAEMEGAMGADFENVRIHTGAHATELSDRIAAQAFTYRNHIFFNAGKFDPAGPQGRFLLAHELTHVVQQGAGGVRNDRHATGMTSSKAGLSSDPIVQRAPKPWIPYEVEGEMDMPEKERDIKGKCADPSQLPETVVKYNFKDKPFSMEAFPLTCNHEDGSPPLQGDPYWPKGRYCVAKTGTGKYWKRMHLLNEKLGGPGDDDRNIIMGSAFLNWHHWDYVENWLKDTILAGAMVRYKVEVIHYGISGTPEQRKRRQFWPYFAGGLKITTQEFEHNDPNQPKPPVVKELVGNRNPPECELSPSDPSMKKENPHRDATPLVIAGEKIPNEGLLALWFGRRQADLLALAAKLRDSKLSVPKRLDALIDEAYAMQELYEGGEDTPIVQGLETDVQAWHAKYEQEMHQGSAALARVAALSLSLTKEKLAGHQATIEDRVLPELADMKRLAFRAEDEDSLEKIQNDKEKILETARNLAAMMKGIRTSMAELDLVIRHVMGGADLLSKLRSIAAGIEEVVRIGKTVWNAFELVTTNWAEMTSAPTVASEMAKGISLSVSAYSAGASLLGATGLASFVTVYLGPLVGACLQMVHELEELRSRTYNRPMIKLKHYGSVNWKIEPGGQAMYHFMKQVMEAGKPGEVPTPSEALQEYFMDQKDRFEAGVQYGHLPTVSIPVVAPLGITLWSKDELDIPNFKRWLFRERAEVWAMLYGSMPVD